MILLGSGDASTRARAATIARIGGNPPSSTSWSGTSGPPTYPLIECPRMERLDSTKSSGPGSRLPEGVRRLLEVLAVSGQPLSQTLAFRAAGLESDGRAALAVLRSGRLARGTGPAEHDRIETYHDRVREAVVAHLEPATLLGHHRRWRESSKPRAERTQPPSPFDFLEAGETDRAGEYYAAAAAQAAETLAFDRAAALYRFALELRPPGGAEGRRLRKELGDALANAGLGREAAEQYLAGADGASAAEALELRRSPTPCSS